MASNMKLTCVTAVFNAIKSGNRERLIRCVESVAKLKAEHEHLIYDGASTDGTVELLQELEAKTLGLKVVSEPDTGIYSALNKGVREAKGEWFYVLGCDDYICKPEVMDELIVELGPNDDILAAAVRIVDRNGLEMLIMYPNLSELFNNPCACHQGELIRTKIARQLGGFDEQYKIAADSDMFLKAHITCCRFKYSREFFAEFTANGTSGDCKAARSEHRLSVANVLGLEGKERERVIRGRSFSIRLCHRFWGHPDLVVRQATHAMIIDRAKATIRVMFYPVIIVVRIVRRLLRGV